MTQTDTAFWFAPPDLSVQYGEMPVRFVFHTYDQPATITVEQPAVGAGATVQFTLPADTCYAYDVSLLVYSIETTPINIILNRGYYIHSTAPITCYYQSISNNRETFTLKGHNALGTHFVALLPLPYQSSQIQYHDIGQTLALIATEDSTRISITTPNWSYQLDTVLRDDIGKDSTVQIVLNRGQSYAVQAYRHSEIIGTRIRASHPIAITATSDANVNYHGNGVPRRFNVAGDQMLPISHWGRRYVWIDHLTHSEMFRSIDYYGVGTGLYGMSANGVRTNGYNYGGYVWNVGYSNHHDSVEYLEIDRPLGTIHQLDPYGMMAATQLPQVDCSGSTQIAYLRSDNLSLKLNLLVPTASVGDLLFNGDSTVLTPTDFRPVPGRPSLSWGIKEVGHLLPNNGEMRVRCTSGRFILSVIETDSIRGTSYTVLTDYAPFVNVRLEEMDTLYCQGDSILFPYEEWNTDSLALHGPNGLLLTTPPFVIPRADSTHSGCYWLEGFSAECSLPHIDSVCIRVQPTPSSFQHDTIAERLLPWTQFGVTFTDEADTLLHFPIAGSQCDSLVYYQLTVLRNVYDTVHYYACESDLPVQFDTATFYQADTGYFVYPAANGADSVVTFILRVRPSTDTILYDTIVEDQLPWAALDTVFTDTVADYQYHTYAEGGCDSTVHYYLYIFWNGDHCDTTLSFPNLVTPNGDGSNDRFVISGLIENNCFKYNELTIYDRTGRQVYHKQNISRDSDWWTPAARRIPAGTYFFYFKAHGIHIRTQHKGVIEVMY